MCWPKYWDWIVINIFVDLIMYLLQITHLSTAIINVDLIIQ